MICSTNGRRADDPKANLVFMRLLLAESGHYILPVNKEDQQLSNEEMDEVQRWWQKPSTATALEQTWHGERRDDGDGYIKKSDKLQFAKDVIDEPYVQKNDKKHDGEIAVGEESEIQVLMGSNFDQEYDDSPQQYQGDVLPGHLPDHKLKYLQKMYKAVPEEFYTQTKRVPVTPRNARSWMKKRKGNHFSFWEWCSGSGRLSLLALLSGLCVMFPSITGMVGILLIQNIARSLPRWRPRCLSCQT